MRATRWSSYSLGNLRIGPPEDYNKKVPLPLLPAPLAELGRRRFAFYPAIKGVEHNEWIAGRANWTEVQVINASSAEELWIPRRLLGEISRADGPVAIVGLLKELEYSQGVVLPHARRVIEMPRAVNDLLHPAVHTHPAAVVEIRAESAGDSRTRKLIRGSVAVGILACVAAGFAVRDLHIGTQLGPWGNGPWGNGPWIGPQRDLPLTAGDDYASVVQKLGSPTSDRWMRTPSGEPYRRLSYPRRGIAVILTGESPDTVTYAGTVAFDGRIVQSAAPDLLEQITAAPAVVRR